MNFNLTIRPINETNLEYCAELGLTLKPYIMIWYKNTVNTALDLLCLGFPYTGPYSLKIRKGSNDKYFLNEIYT